jgi:hypothetical protein
MYNSPEERMMIQSLSGNYDTPSVVVGIGSDVPSAPQPARFRQKFEIAGPFAVYVGRIDENKGCKELFQFFESYLRASAGKLSLVLIGNSWLSIPSHPRIRHLGYLDDVDKFGAMAAADLLIMPSYFESLSMVALEAWALGRPVLANAKCDVLKGQCIRSNAGLYYDGASEFVECLSALEHSQWLRATLGRRGHRFFREHYDWPIIERKYLDMLNRLSATGDARPGSSGVEPLSGWFDRRKRVCPAAADVLAGLPAGPSLDAESIGARVDTSAAPVPKEPGAPGRPNPAPERRRFVRHSRLHRGNPSRRTGGRS